MKHATAVLIAVAALLAGLAGWLLPPTAAAQDSITISKQGVENRFPDGLSFYIEAESAATINEIRVYVRKLGQSSRTTYRSVEFEPGRAVSGEALFQSKSSNEYIPPGTRLEYHFDIRTADGSSLETPPETITYLNTGLNWQLKSVGLINVYYYRYDSQSEARADAVLQAADDTYALMGPILGVELTEPMTIVVYSNYSHMREALDPGSRVAASQLRILGKAFSNERALLVDGSNDLWLGDNTVTTAAHEFTHLLVADAAGSANSQVHTWLNEGLAVYSERRPDSEFDRYIQSAIFGDRVPPLAGLRTFAGTPDETLRAYAQGHAVVTYMLAAYDQRQMAELFTNIRTLHNFEKALVAAYGMTVPELDNRWRASVGLAPRDLSTPPPPPLQVLPTRRPTPTPPPPANAPPAPMTPAADGVPAPATATAPATVAGVASATLAAPTPTQPPAPTYTPMPEPTRSTPAQSSEGGCGAAPAGSAHPSSEMAAMAMLAIPAGLLALVRINRKRRE